MDQARYDYIIITRNTDKIKTAVFHLLLLLFFGSGREMVVPTEHSLICFLLFSCVFLSYSIVCYYCILLLLLLLLLLYSYCGRPFVIDTVSHYL